MKNCLSFFGAGRRAFSSATGFFEFFSGIFGTKNSAFSLVEMLMALLVASLLLAALAPVITKKMNENVIVSGTGNAVMLQGGCVFMEGSYENVCKLPQNTLAIGAIIASGGGGGGGAAKASFGAVKYTDTLNGITTGAVTSNTVTLDKNASNVTVQLTGGGGGGGLGLSNNGGYPKNQADCGNWGVYIGPEYEGAGDTTLPSFAGSHPAPSTGYHSICVSRRNPEIDGANNSPKLNVSGVQHADVGLNCSGSNCCWIGKTTTSSDCDTFKNGMTYSACNRSVCQYDAAATICLAWKPQSTTDAGRLPTHKEMLGWERGMNDSNNMPGVLNKPGSYNSGAGLEFCSREPAASMHCFYNTICLYTGSASPCNPDSTWTDTSAPERGEDYYYVGYMGGSSFSANVSFIKTGSLAVRCVIDRISPFSPVIGGGGASSIYTEMKIPEDTIRKALSEGVVKITYTAGGGGKGAYIQTNSADSNYIQLTDTSRTVSAQKGERSSASMTVNGITKWEFSVPGGNPGGNAAVNTIGTGGSQINISSSEFENACYYKNVYSKNANYKAGGYFACNSINDNGSAPNINAGNKGTDGGSGGNGYFAGSSKTGGGVGSTPSYGGAGGGGGTCSEGPTRDYVTCSKAGDGGGGMARITYKLSRPGAGGGGGAAGAVVHIPNITTAIRPDTVFNISVGAGGNGGAAGGLDEGSNGSNGGTSSIEWKDGNTTRYIKVAGGKGGKGGMQGKPDEGINGVDSKPGEGGAAGGEITMSSGIAGRNDYIVYPDDLSKTAGKTVIPNTDYIVNRYAAPGGNGGINSKISPLDKKPCGGWSNTKIDFYGAKDVVDDEETLGCKLRNTDDTSNIYAGTFTPYSVAVTSSDPYRPDGGFKGIYANIMSKTNSEKYAGSTIGGSTGGGGGGWKWHENEDEQASAGANGMAGYVIIYWNLQEEGE